MKVFCIGSNKTGTTSMEQAIKKLGFNPIPSTKAYGLYLGGGLKHSKENMIQLFKAFRLRKYTANLFCDIPFNLEGSHEMLYDMFPDAYFIHLTRDPEKWFNSVLNWIQLKNAQVMYNWIWKIEFIPENKAEIIDRYHKRNEEIIEFFKDKPRFLLIDIEDKNKYATLCKFLDREIVVKPFPHANKSL